MLLLGCADATRYVIVPEGAPAADQDSADRRLVCLATADARANPALLDLRTTASVRKYGETRVGDHGAVEAVLFALVSGEYAAAQQLLDARGAELPGYLRGLVTADLANERATTISYSSLVRLYQEAYDAQESELGRRIVRLRVRQARYGR
jgi:hypothetical protein